jgi:hypothetical protein
MLAGTSDSGARRTSCPVLPRRHDRRSLEAMCWTKIPARPGPHEITYDQEFLASFEKLPKATQLQATKAYRLWRHEPSHPSLHFKPVHTATRSIRCE